MGKVLLREKLHLGQLPVRLPVFARNRAGPPQVPVSDVRRQFRLRTCENGQLVIPGQMLLPHERMPAEIVLWSEALNRRYAGAEVDLTIETEGGDFVIDVSRINPSYRSSRLRFYFDTRNLLPWMDYYSWDLGQYVKRYILHFTSEHGPVFLGDISVYRWRTVSGGIVFAVIADDLLTRLTNGFSPCDVPFSLVHGRPGESSSIILGCSKGYLNAIAHIFQLHPSLRGQLEQLGNKEIVPAQLLQILIDVLAARTKAFGSCRQLVEILELYSTNESAFLTISFAALEIANWLSVPSDENLPRANDGIAKIECRPREIAHRVSLIEEYLRGVPRISKESAEERLQQLSLHPSAIKVLSSSDEGRRLLDKIEQLSKRLKQIISRHNRIQLLEEKAAQKVAQRKGKGEDEETEEDGDS